MWQAKETKKQRAKVADIEKSNASSKSTATRRQSKKHSIVAEKRVIALEAELKEAQDAQKWSNDEANKTRKRANNAVAQFAESF